MRKSSLSEKLQWTVELSAEKVEENMDVLNDISFKPPLADVPIGAGDTIRSTDTLYIEYFVDVVKNLNAIVELQRRGIVVVREAFRAIDKMGDQNEKE
jgi:hypothetical protein